MDRRMPVISGMSTLNGPYALYVISGNVHPLRPARRLGQLVQAKRLRRIGSMRQGDWYWSADPLSMILLWGQNSNRHVTLLEFQTTTCTFKPLLLLCTFVISLVLSPRTTAAIDLCCCSGSICTRCMTFFIAYSAASRLRRS